MAEIQVARVQSTKKDNKRELYATVCYYYAQYTLQEVQKLPARDLYLLIRTAQKLEALKMYNLTNIAAAPHTKNGSAVKKIAEQFKRMAN